MDAINPPKLLISFRRITMDTQQMAYFNLATDDYIRFEVDTNMEDFDPGGGIGTVLYMMFCDDGAYDPVPISHQFEAEQNGWYEAHTTYGFEDNNAHVTTIDIITFGSTKLLAFMLNENAVEMMRISYNTGKQLYEINLTDGGKWLFKM